MDKEVLEYVMFTISFPRFLIHHYLVPKNDIHEANRILYKYNPPNIKNFASYLEKYKIKDGVEINGKIERFYHLINY